MSKTVIQVENLSKQYRLGEVSTGTISHDVNRWWHKIRGKEDPYLKIGEANDRSIQGNSDYVWALKDIHFEVKQGEVLGIIGRNGAGKSTLLKILSRTTAPTIGSVKIRGRVASLLEVGTGFHPELSGRENIFLNGTILGMTRREIKHKFDEIVDFAGVERYIDTPVKRYSSGMYVRLAFAVAAHLDPEILIVDEVLAVGDADFQQKALGKMKNVSNQEGRTVLFVSHNMQALKNLCSQALVIENGKIITFGQTDITINSYLNLDTLVCKRFTNTPIITEDFIFEGAAIFPDLHQLLNSTSLIFEFYFIFITKKKYSVAIYFYRYESLAFCSMDLHKPLFKNNNIIGKTTIILEIPKYLLNPGKYSIHLALIDYNGNTTRHFYQEDIFIIEIHDDGFRRGGRYNLGWEGGVSPILNWSLKNNLE